MSIMLVFARGDYSFQLVNPVNHHRVEFRRHSLKNKATLCTIRIYEEPGSDKFETGPPVSIEEADAYCNEFISMGFKRVTKSARGVANQ